jgi:hypothetical protein
MAPLFDRHEPVQFFGPVQNHIDLTCAVGTSASSNEITLVIGGTVCGTAPGPPANLQALTGANGTVVFSWTPAAPSPTSYVLDAGSSPGASDVASGSLASASPTLTASSVPRATYFVRVRGRNSCGIGPASNEVRVDVGS